MAAEVGISPSSVRRIWSEASLKTHLVCRFKISNGRQFQGWEPTVRLGALAGPFCMCSQAMQSL
jgi:hypothetical protein